MTKNITIDLKGIKDKLTLMDYIATNAEGMQRVDDKSPTNWSAFSDDLCCFNLAELENSQEKKINIVFLNWDSFREKFPQDDYNTFLSILLHRTDPTQRVDGYDFTFQIRLEKY